MFSHPHSLERRRGHACVPTILQERDDPIQALTTRDKWPPLDSDLIPKKIGIFCCFMIDSLLFSIRIT